MPNGIIEGTENITSVPSGGDMFARGIFFIVLLLCPVCCFPAQGEGQAVFSVGIMSSADKLFYEETVDSLLQGIQKALGPKVRLDVFVGTPRQIQKKVEDGQLRIIFCNSLLYRALLPYGVRDLATIHSHWNPNPNRSEGATVVVSRSSKIDSLASLFRDKTAKNLIATDREFDVLYYVLKELHRQKLDPDRFMAQVVAKDMTDAEIVRQVIDGKATSGLLPCCFLEQYAVTDPRIFTELRVLNSVRSSEVPCTISTTLYPNWSLLITPSISMKDATDIALSLLSLPHDQNHVWWSVSTQFEHVDSLLRDLKVEQYSYLRQWTLKGFIENYLFVFIVLGALILSIIFYSLFANRLIRIRSRQLAMSLERQSQYKRDFDEARKRIDIFRRMGIMTQISNIISHELKQPLNAISCYAQGLLIKLEQGKATKEQCIDIVYEINNKTKLAGDIIARVRNFARHERHPKRLEINSAIQKAIDSFVLARHSTEEIRLVRSDPCYAMLDAFEFELLCVNLLRNASEALESVSDARILITVKSEEDRLMIIFEDNGKAISEERLKRMTMDFDSTKPKGSGFGLVIVSEIVAEASGLISLEAKKEGGLRVSITLPKIG